MSATSAGRGADLILDVIHDNYPDWLLNEGDYCAGWAKEKAANATILFPMAPFEHEYPNDSSFCTACGENYPGTQTIERVYSDCQSCGSTHILHYATGFPF